MEEPQMNHGGVKAIAENVWITFVARVSTAIGIPFALFIMYGLWSDVRQLNNEAIATKITIEAIKTQQSIETLTRQDLTERVRDLEEIVRALETLIRERVGAPEDARNSGPFQGGGRGGGGAASRRTAATANEAGGAAPR